MIYAETVFSKDIEMTLFESIVLGLVQGLTEFLPVSSSGHLVLFQQLFGIREGVLLFDIAVHIGTLIPIVLIFRDDFKKMLSFRENRLTLLLIAGTIPTAIIGFIFKKHIEELFISGKTIGIEFMITGCILWAAESLKKGYKGAPHHKLAGRGIRGNHAGDRDNTGHIAVRPDDCGLPFSRL